MKEDFGRGRKGRKEGMYGNKRRKRKKESAVCGRNERKVWRNVDFFLYC